MKPMPNVSHYLKAIVGALVAGLGSLYQALDDGGVSSQEWVAVALATAAALGVVYGTPNADPKGKHQDESVQPAQGGYGALETVILGLFALILLFVLLSFIR